MVMNQVTSQSWFDACERSYSLNMISQQISKLSGMDQKATPTKSGVKMLADSGDGDIFQPWEPK